MSDRGATPWKGSGAWLLAVGLLAGGSAHGQGLQLEKLPGRAVEAEEPKTGPSTGIQNVPKAAPLPGPTRIREAPPLQPEKQPQPPRIRLDCAHVMCIERVEVIPHGTWVELEVFTTRRAAVEIQTSFRPPDGQWRFAKVERSIATLRRSLDTKTQITGLLPDRDYHFVVKAKGEDGLIQWSKGSFSTTGRSVTVTIRQIHVYDDGDDGSAGTGEFTIHVWAMGKMRAGLSGEYTSGGNYYPWRSFTLKGVPAQLGIEVGVDEADGPSSQPGMANPAPAYKGVFNVETTGPGEDDRLPWAIRASDGEYDIELSGTLHVSYE